MKILLERMLVNEFTMKIPWLLFVAQTPSTITNLYGEWMLRHTTITDIPSNRVVVHIYPDEKLTICYRFTKGPFVFHKSKVGSYSVESLLDNQSNVDITFKHAEEQFLSGYGIGLQEMNIRTLRKKIDSSYFMSMTIVGTNDMYLRSRTNDNVCFHLVRSVRINEPALDIPIATFIISQIIATLLGHVIHLILFHTPG